MFAIRQLVVLISMLSCTFLVHGEEIIDFGAAVVCPDNSEQKGSCCLATGICSNSGDNCKASSGAFPPPTDGGSFRQNQPNTACKCVPEFPTCVSIGGTKCWGETACIEGAAACKCQATGGELFEPGLFCWADGAEDQNFKFCGNPATATSDPHLVGASGVKYDFDGEPGSTYSLFSAPQFQVAMHLAGNGPGTHFMTQIGLLFKGEEFLFGESTMTEAFRADLEDRLTRVGGALLDWSSCHAKLSLCPGHTVSLMQMHTIDPSLMHADGSPYNYYDVEIVSPGCHDTYGGALGQTYKCKYAGEEAEAFAWSHEQEKGFRLHTLFMPSGSYSVEAPCDADPAGSSLSGASARHQRRGLMSGAGKPVEVQVQAKAIDPPAEESHDALSSHPLGRYRKRAGRLTTEA